MDWELSADTTASLEASAPGPRWARSVMFGLAGLIVTISSGPEAISNVWSGVERAGASAPPVPATVVPSALELQNMLQKALRRRQVAEALETLGMEATLTVPVVAAVERQAARIGMDPLLVVAVITFENPVLDPAATSPVGARGIMQVMPQWGPSFRAACGEDLLAIETNVCFGVRILQSHIDDAHGSLAAGLLGYVGCVKNLACRQYPELVLRRWHALSERVLAH
jgi:soluble lytic murein transglycosylase-like protein